MEGANMKIPKKINILGTEYKVKIKEKIDGDFAGLCNPCSKIIYLAERLFEKNDESVYNKDLIFKHEVFHGFLDEAGYQSASENEDFVNLLAIQFDKLAKIFGYMRA